MSRGAGRDTSETIPPPSAFAPRAEGLDLRVSGGSGFLASRGGPVHRPFLLSSCSCFCPQFFCPRFFSLFSSVSSLQSPSKAWLNLVSTLYPRPSVSQPPDDICIIPCLPPASERGLLRFRLKAHGPSLGQRIIHQHHPRLSPPSTSLSRCVDTYCHASSEAGRDPN